MADGYYRITGDDDSLLDALVTVTVRVDAGGAVAEIDARNNLTVVKVRIPTQVSTEVLLVCYGESF